MSVIFDKEIKRRINDEGLIEDHTDSNIQGASYDMRLGSECAKDGELLDLEKEGTLKVYPGEFALLTTFEKLKFPKNMVGRNGIMSKWAKRGIVSLFSPQVDPGFVGMLIVPVFNAGDKEVLLRFKDSVFTVEFDIGEGEATHGWSEKNGRQTHLTSEHVQALEYNLSFYRDIFFAKNELEKLRSITDKYKREVEQLTEKQEMMEQRITIHTEKYDNEIESIRNDSKTRQPFIVMWASIISAVLIGVVLKMILK